MRSTDWWRDWIGMIFGSPGSWRQWAMGEIRKQETERK
jgi:hypothetical protein